MEAMPQEGLIFNESEGVWYYNGVRVKEARPATRWKKSGSASSVHHKQVGGDLRDAGAGIGGSINTKHQGSNYKRPTEERMANKE